MDCLYHGYSGAPGGECEECKEEEKRRLEPGAIQPDPDIKRARLEMGEHNPLVQPDAGHKKKRSQ